MTYRIVYSTKARRALSEVLPEAVASACAEFIGGALAENPHRVGKALKAPLDGLHSARRGAFRIVYRVGDGAVTVLVVSVEHRRDVYHR